MTTQQEAGIKIDPFLVRQERFQRLENLIKNIDSYAFLPNYYEHKMYHYGFFDEPATRTESTQDDMKGRIAIDSINKATRRSGVVAGGYLRSNLIGECPNDVDIFFVGKYAEEDKEIVLTNLRFLKNFRIPCILVDITSSKAAMVSGFQTKAAGTCKAPINFVCGPHYKNIEELFKNFNLSVNCLAIHAGSKTTWHYENNSMGVGGNSLFNKHSIMMMPVENREDFTPKVFLKRMGKIAELYLREGWEPSIAFMRRASILLTLLGTNPSPRVPSFSPFLGLEKFSVKSEGDAPGVLLDLVENLSEEQKQQFEQQKDIVFPKDNINFSLTSIEKAITKDVPPKFYVDFNTHLC